MACPWHSKLEVIIIVIPVSIDKGLHAAKLLRHFAEVLSVVQSHVQDFVCQPVNFKVSGGVL